MNSKRRPREDPCQICGHYHDFEGGEPCSVCGHVMAAAQQRKPGEPVIPANIIPGFLYLGSYDTASRSGLLKTMGITHILNTVPSCQVLFKNTFIYHTVSSAPPDYDECLQFIEETRKLPDTKVLVYCMSGASRSPGVVISYLMKTRGWRLAESYKWVKDKRPTIQIHTDEASRLMELDTALYGSCSAPNGLAVLDSASLAFPTVVPVGAAGPLAAAVPAPAAVPQVPSQAPTFCLGSNQPQWSMGGEPSSCPTFGGTLVAPFTFRAAPSGQAVQADQDSQGGEMEM